MCGSPASIGNAHGSKLMGLFVALATVLAVKTFHNITSGSLKLGCDNEGGLYLSSLLSLKVKPSKKHNILRYIRSVTSDLPLDLTFEHILRHQDDTVTYQNLDRMSQLNVDCDLVTKTGLVRIHHIWQHQQDTLSHEAITIRINGSKIVGNVRVPLRNEILRLSMKEFLISKDTITSLAFDLVNWDAFEQMISQASHAQVMSFETH